MDMANVGGAVCCYPRLRHAVFYVYLIPRLMLNVVAPVVGSKYCAAKTLYNNLLLYVLWSLSDPEINAEVLQKPICQSMYPS
jgi:hypothetical protein